MRYATSTIAGLWDNLYARDPTGLAQLLIEHIVGPVAVVAAVWAGGLLLQRIASRAMETAGADAQVRTLVNNVIGVTALVLALLCGLTAAGLSVGVLLTFGGLASLAAGFAFQDLLRNVLAGIFLLLERPFRIGDVIAVGDQTGVVQAIHLRTTRLRTLDGRMAILPNLASFNAPVINSSAYQTRRYELALWVPAGADLDRAVRVVQRELRGIPALARGDTPPMVIPKVDGDGGSTLLQVRYWLDYRRHDPDAVAAELARRIRVAVGATLDQTTEAARNDPSLPDASDDDAQIDGAASMHVAGISSGGRTPRRRMPRLLG